MLQELLTWQEILVLLVVGGAGAFLRLIVRDGSLQLPYFKNGSLYLGFIGALIIGGGVGFLVDGNVVSAFLAGYTGSSLLDKLVFKNQGKYGLNEIDGK